MRIYHSDIVKIWCIYWQLWYIHQWDEWYIVMQWCIGSSIDIRTVYTCYNDHTMIVSNIVELLWCYVERIICCIYGHYSTFASFIFIDAYTINIVYMTIAIIATWLYMYYTVDKSSDHVWILDIAFVIISGDIIDDDRW